MRLFDVADQRGFSLLEISVATTVILLLAIIGIPAIGNYVIESKVPKVGEGLARFIVQSKVNAEGLESAPYQGMNTSMLAESVSDSSVFSVIGSGGSARVLHGLGERGEVHVAERLGGSAFSITLTQVGGAACPSIASVLHRVSDTISLEAHGKPAVLVKGVGQPYNALMAKSRCNRANSNTFVFTIQ